MGKENQRGCPTTGRGKTRPPRVEARYVETVPQNLSTVGLCFDGGGDTCIMTNITLRDYYAAHAPAVPGWFTSTITKTKTEMIPDPQRGHGYVKSNTVVIEETPMQKEVRWRFAFADAMLLGPSPAV